MTTRIQNKKDKASFEGKVCKNLQTGRNLSIVIIPEKMSMFEAFSKGLFNAEKNIDFDTFINNPKRFKLIED